MPYFLCRLVPPRPTFAADMSERERSAMTAHAAFWTDLAHEGLAVIFGPVVEPAGVWGLGIVETESEEDARSLAGRDPVASAGIGMRIDVLPILRPTLRAEGRLGADA